MKTKNIRQVANFSASPHEVYEALMDSKKHSRFTASRASISRKVGGKISAYDGWIEGVNLELVQDKRIVQKWRGDDWPKGHYSIAKFVISSSKGGAKLVFTQTGVPEDQYADIKQGWVDYYWKSMEEMFSSQK